MRLLLSGIVVMCCVSLTEAGRNAVSVPVSEVVQKLDAKVSFGSSGVARASNGRAVKVKDKRLAETCGVQYSASVCDGTSVEYAGFGDCDKPVSASRETSDCGSTKSTTITHRSGKKVTITTRSGKRAIVDYDRN